jgi:ferrochelatase
VRVSTKTLNTLAGVVWFAVGVGLTTVGVRFVFGLNEGGDEGTSLEIGAALALAGLIGFAKGKYVLSRTARRNRRRIAALAEPRLWHVFTPTFYLLILGMMGLGRWLRALAADGSLGGYIGVGGIYVGIGLALGVASIAYFAKRPPGMPTRVEIAPGERAGPKGVLLVNLGSPAAPTPREVRRFLRQFLGDPRVVEVNRALWAFVLNVIILPFRCWKSAELYRSIWTQEGSPLIVHGRRLRELVALQLGDGFHVALGMRYGEPSLSQALSELEAQGCTDVVVLPLFPQYSNTTTGSVVAEVARLALRERSQPSLAFVAPFYEHSLYIEALARRAETCDRGDFTVFSFHGLPESYVKSGDPYLEQCGRTAWLLAERLGLERSEWELVFQSRFGDEPWLQPYLDEYVPALAPERRRVRVIAPAFAADCLETLEEIGIRLRSDFLAAGGDELIVVPGLNDDPAWVHAVVELVRGPTSSTASVP